MFAVHNRNKSNRDGGFWTNRQRIPLAGIEQGDWSIVAAGCFSTLWLMIDTTTSPLSSIGFANEFCLPFSVSFGISTGIKLESESNFFGCFGSTGMVIFGLEMMVSNELDAGLWSRKLELDDLRPKSSSSRFPKRASNGEKMDVLLGTLFATGEAWLAGDSTSEPAGLVALGELYRLGDALAPSRISWSRLLYGLAGLEGGYGS